MCILILFIFLKQKTAYEMRISDWSSDVCSSDLFKHINDSLGHPVGDTVLKIITARLEASVRLEDTVASLGGDAFVVLLSGLQGTRSAVSQQVPNLADTLRVLLSTLMFLDGQRFQITPLTGLDLFPAHVHTQTDLLTRAHIALSPTQKLRHPTH